MRARAHSVFTQEPDSLEAGRIVGSALARAFAPHELKAVVVYAAINHEQFDVLSGIREALGGDVILVGCSSQGIVSNEFLSEEGFVLAAMGFGGDVAVHSARVLDAPDAPWAKGHELAAQLVAGLQEPARLVVIFYDASCALDVQEFLAGMTSILACPLVGAGASHRWGPPVTTYQYFASEVASRSAVALALAGPWDVEIGVCHGTSPTGLSMCVTRSDRNRILELDGRPALDVFREATGFADGEIVLQDHLASWAIAMEVPLLPHGASPASQADSRLVRAASGFDFDSGAIIVQASIPTGSRIVFHHRTVKATRDGSRAMAALLAERLRGRHPWAVLGFECGARTAPFLGTPDTKAEHEELREAIGVNVPWLGLMAWGEIAPLGETTVFHNYTYPLAVLVEREK